MHPRLPSITGPTALLALALLTVQPALTGCGGRATPEGPGGQPDIADAGAADQESPDLERPRWPPPDMDFCENTCDCCGVEVLVACGDPCGPGTDRCEPYCGAADGGPADAAAIDATAACTDSRPFCAQFCGSDYQPEGPECVEGSWVCPPGSVDPADCPAGTCWGPPTAGEVCGPAGWECRPEPAAYQVCPELMCPECTGFDGPTEVEGCRCECQGGSVICQRLN